LLVFEAIYDAEESFARVPAGSRDFERSAAVKRVAKLFHAFARGTPSQPKSRPRKNRRFTSARVAGESLNGFALRLPSAKPIERDPWPSVRQIVGPHIMKRNADKKVVDP